MLHNRLNISVASAQDIIDAILAFVTDAAWASPWVEDPSYTVAGNPGEMVLQSPGGTAAYLYFNDNGGGDFLHIGCAQVNATWNTGAPPAAGEVAITTDVAFQYDLGLEAPTIAGHTGTLHLFGDNDRIIVLYNREPDDTWWLIYAGLYQPLCAPADDPIPVAVFGNMVESGNGTSIPTESHVVSQVKSRFPNIGMKFGPNGKRRYFAQISESVWAGGKLVTIPHKSEAVPKDDRAAAEQVFTFAQYITIAEAGRGEAISLAGSTATDGILRTTDGLEPLTQVTVGVDTYVVAPMALTAGANDPGVFLIGPIGTAI